MRFAATRGECPRHREDCHFLPSTELSNVDGFWATVVRLPSAMSTEGILSPTLTSSTAIFSAVDDRALDWLRGEKAVATATITKRKMLVRNMICLCMMQ